MHQPEVAPMNPHAFRLARTGVLLFVVGLILGGAIPLFTNPRMALSAHLTATQCGIALVAFGLLWPHVGVPERWSALLSHTIWLSIYTLTLGLTLAAAFGASEALPIAGAGHKAKPWQEAMVTSLVLGSSAAMLVALAAWLVSWRYKRNMLSLPAAKAITAKQS
jgi:(hydroxyamino)benzene mutase